MANKHENLNTNPGNLDQAALFSPIPLYVPYSYRVGFITLNFFFFLLSTLYLLFYLHWIVGVPPTIWQFPKFTNKWARGIQSN